MKADLFIIWLEMIAFVFIGVYVIIWQPLPIDVVILIGMLVVLVICALFWAGKDEITLRRYGKIDWYKKMGFHETACMFKRN